MSSKMCIRNNLSIWWCVSHVELLSKMYESINRCLHSATQTVTRWSFCTWLNITWRGGMSIVPLHFRALKVTSPFLLWQFWNYRLAGIKNKYYWRPRVEFPMVRDLCGNLYFEWWNEFLEIIVDSVFVEGEQNFSVRRIVCHYRHYTS
jgi:hypothetical protein